MRMVALKITDVRGMRLVTAYGSRGKNRQVLWSYDMAGKTNQQIRDKVVEKEDERLGKFEPFQELTDDRPE